MDQRTVTQAVRTVRYGDFAAAMEARQSRLSYNRLTPVPETDRQGRARPCAAPPIRLSGLDVYRLLAPYTSSRLIEQARTVLPLAAYLIVFQLIILRTAVENPWPILGGTLAVIIGLMLFMEGLKQGLMPLGEMIGEGLPRKEPLPMVLAVILLLGIGVTLAEPAIGALRAAGAIVDAQEAPLLWTLLNRWPGALVLSIGAGVGAAAVLGTLRFVYGWSLKPLIYACLVPTLALTAWVMTDPQLRHVIGLAWDCGAVTTGPVTVPLVLALGIGVARTAGGGESSLSGFGIVTLASLFPILATLGLALYVAQGHSPEDLLPAAAPLEALVPAWHARTPFREIIAGVRAIVPLVLFLLAVMVVLVREPIREPGIKAYGLVLSLLGMIVFNIGLSYGLSALGNQSGGLVPAAFIELGTVSDSPLYPFALGIGIALLFAWLLGFGATLAEPALNALGLTVETLTNGAFRKSLLMYAVSIGVGCGIALGIAKIVFAWPLAWMLLPAYALALALTAVSREEFVNVAWDSAGVTTGPVTVPLVLAMGLGFGDATQALEGFGVLALASVGPILSVLTLGLLIDYSARARRSSKEPDSMLEEPAQ